MPLPLKEKIPRKMSYLLFPRVTPVPHKTSCRACGTVPMPNRLVCIGYLEEFTVNAQILSLLKRVVQESFSNSLQLSWPGSPPPPVASQSTRRATPKFCYPGEWAACSRSSSSEEDPELLGFMESCIQASKQSITLVKRQSRYFPFFKTAIPFLFMEEFETGNIAGMAKGQREILLQFSIQVIFMSEIRYSIA